MVTLQGQSVLMEVYNGVVQSEMGEAKFKRRFPPTALEVFDVKWRGYLGHPSVVNGKTIVVASSNEGRASNPCLFQRRSSGPPRQEFG